MRQKIVLMLAVLTFCQVHSLAQPPKPIYTSADIMSKFNSDPSSVVGLVMEVSLINSISAGQWQEKVGSNTIGFSKTDNPTLDANTKYITITSMYAIQNMTGWYRATGTAYTPPAPLPDCNRHYQSAVKFIVDTPVVHPFTVSAGGRQVAFSSGNLQYCPARDEWRFALRQFDRVGKGKSVYAPEGLKTAGTNINDNGTTVFYDSIDYSTKDNTTASGFKEIKGVPCNNTFVSKKYGGWVDMFAWGTSGQGRRAGDSLTLFFSPYDLNGEDLGHAANKFGYGPSFDAGHGPGAKSNDIDAASGTNQCFDWGYRNLIREYHNCVYDANQALVVQTSDSTMYRRGVWRTLTADEWKYLLTERIVDGNDSAFSYVRLQYGKNTTDTVSGVLIYPDDFSFSEAGVASLPFGATYGVSTIDASVWNALEEAGVVFLPTAYQAYPVATNDNHMNLNDGGLGQMGFYWSSTASDGAKAEHVRFEVINKSVSVEATNRMDFISVRLVQDLNVRTYYATLTKECSYAWNIGDKTINITQNNAGVKIYRDTLRTTTGEDSIYCILTLKKKIRITEVKDTTYSIGNYTFTYGTFSKTWNLNDTGHAVNTTQIYEIPLKDGDCDTAMFKLTLTRKRTEFSVADNRKVVFSSGNLQFQASTGTWRFAERQFDRCGRSGNETTVYWNNNGTQSKADNRQVSSNYAGWIDLFGWGTSGKGTDAGRSYPWLTSTDGSVYGPASGNFDAASESNRSYDWGYANEIMEGTKKYPAGTWRTPNTSEWDYIFTKRAKLNGNDPYSFVHVRFGSGSNDTVRGALIYPDGFTFAKAGVTAITTGAAAAANINAETWAKLEKAGCLFLPGCGYRDGTSVANNFHINANYWSSTANTSTDAYKIKFYFQDRKIESSSTDGRRYAFPVRLVRDL